LNPQPPDLESDALPLELLACISKLAKSVRQKVLWIDVGRKPKIPFILRINEASKTAPPQQSILSRGGAYVCDKICSIY
jgi:hypothetical protein